MLTVWPIYAPAVSLLRAARYSYKSDLWGLGCVLYEMANGRHAFDAQSLNGLACAAAR